MSCLLEVLQSHGLLEVLQSRGLHYVDSRLLCRPGDDISQSNQWLSVYTHISIMFTLPGLIGCVWTDRLPLLMGTVNAKVKWAALH